MPEDNVTENKTELPEGYTLLNGIPGEIWAETVLDNVNRLGKEADERNPDFQDMYIYNDYYGYACINLIEEELKDIQKLIKKNPTAKETIEALEALTIWMCMEDSYTGIDDGECYYALVRCFGAAWHIVAVALQDENKLNAEYLPNISNVFLTVDALLKELNSIGDPITGAGMTLRLMLARAGLPHAPKPSPITRPRDPDDDGKEEEEDPEPPRKRKRSTEPDLEELAKLPHAEAEKKLGQSKKLASYDFNKLFNSYKRNWCYAERTHGVGFNIVKWPEELRKEHSFDQYDD